jgi:hypothetical protein
MSGGFTGGLDNSQSYLGAGDGGSYGSGVTGGFLRDTAIQGYQDSEESNRARFLASHRFVRGVLSVEREQCDDVC